MVRKQTLVVLLMGLLLTACARSTEPPEVVTPNLPAAPANFGKPIVAPKLAKGANIKTFALETRAALVQANRRLENDETFYGDVQREFSRKE